MPCWSRRTKEYPDDVDLLYEQSMMAEKLNRMDEMERLLRKVIAPKPDHHHAYNALGYLLAEATSASTRPRDLIRTRWTSAPASPSSPTAWAGSSTASANRGEALRLLQQAYRARPDAEIAAHLGEVLWVTGQHDEARRVWREAKTRDAGNDVLRATLARLRVDL